MEKTLQCSINRIGCKGKAEYVCHHCGRLLCNGPNCSLWAWDSAFAGLPIAYHCPGCDHLPLIGKLFRAVINGSNHLYDSVLWIVEGIKKARINLIEKLSTGSKSRSDKKGDLKIDSNTRSTTKDQPTEPPAEHHNK